MTASRRKRAAGGIALVCFLAAAGLLAATWSTQPVDVPPPPLDLIAFEPLPTSRQPPWSTRQVKVKRGDVIARLLTDQGLPHSEVRAVIEAAKPHTDLVKIRIGETLTFRYRGDQVLALVKPLDRWRERLLVVTLEGEPQASIEARATEHRPVSAAAEVDYTLWDAGAAIGLSGDNLANLAAIFAWDMDFNTQVQRGDRFRLVIDAVYDAETGERIRYGDILAAEYRRSNGEVMVGYRYEDDDGDVAFFDAEGNATRRPFLKSPIEFSRVSSRFGRRYHPILKRWRAHRGTDYAATTGTPIRSIGDGVVSFLGTKGGYGRHVRIQHNDEHASSYSHLSAYSVRNGEEVRQGQVIGKVGSTGLATGPHLHFEFYRHGKQVDYGSMTFERTDPLAVHERPLFDLMIEAVQPLLEGMPFPDGTCIPPVTIDPDDAAL